MPILAALLPWFRQPAEHVATFALHHIFSTYPSTRPALLALIPGAGSLNANAVSLQAQERDAECGEPDLVLRDPAGQVVAAIEATFGAAAGATQPASQFQVLEMPHGGLLYIAPAHRKAALAAELADACRKASLRVRGESESTFRADGHTVAVVSWQEVIAAMREAAEKAGQDFALSDLDQLEALCIRMGNEAYTFETADLAAERSRAFLALSALVRRIAERGDERELWTIAGGISYGEGETSIPVQIGAWRAYLQLNAQLWAEHGQPLWLGLTLRQNRTAQPPPEHIRLGLAALGVAPVEKEHDRIYIPLVLSPGVDVETPGSGVLAQVERIAAQFKPDRSQ